jgi:hypothetical protein
MEESFMGWFKKRKVNDERIINMQNKIFKELYYVILGICAVSIIVKQAYFGLGFKDFLTETVILIIPGLYYTFRTVQLGIFSDEVEIHDRTSKISMTKKNVIYSLVGGVAIAIFMGLNSAIRYGDGGWQTVYTFLLVFAVTFLFYIPVLVIVFVFGHEIAKSKSDKVIEKQLEELDGDDNEKY